MLPGKSSSPCKSGGDEWRMLKVSWMTWPGNSLVIKSAKIGG